MGQVEGTRSELSGVLPCDGLKSLCCHRLPPTAHVGRKLNQNGSWDQVTLVFIRVTQVATYPLQQVLLIEAPSFLLKMFTHIICFVLFVLTH